MLFQGAFSRFRIWAAHPRQYQIKCPPGSYVLERVSNTKSKAIDYPRGHITFAIYIVISHVCLSALLFLGNY